MGDMVLVEGLPVGNIFSFLWNLMSKLLRQLNPLKKETNWV
jgi:hypothetical protein